MALVCTKVMRTGAALYHQQQNKCYPKGVYLPISKLLSILVVAKNLLAHNNTTVSNYVQVNSLRLKSNVISKWASKHLWGTIYFAGDSTQLTRVGACVPRLPAWIKVALLKMITIIL